MQTPRLPQKRLMQRCAKQGTPYAALTTVSCCKNLGIPTCASMFHQTITLTTGGLSRTPARSSATPFVTRMLNLQASATSLVQFLRGQGACHPHSLLSEGPVRFQVLGDLFSILLLLGRSTTNSLVTPCVNHHISSWSTFLYGGPSSR